VLSCEWFYNAGVAHREGRITFKYKLREPAKPLIVRRIAMTACFDCTEDKKWSQGTGHKY